MGLRKHLDWHGATCSSIKALEVPFQVKLTKMPLVNPGLIESQSQSKLSQNKTFFMFLHQTWATRWFSSSLTQSLTYKGTRNLNFDPIVRMGWDQYHCKEYQILFPTTIHGLKLELKWLRYPENCAKHVSTLPKAITFNLTIRFVISLVLWKLDI